MGKPYDHEYYFAGSGCSKGEMTCGHCHHPIFNHNQDWMSYKKSKSYDWSYHCFHRKCRHDQSGWEKIEAAYKKEEERTAVIKEKIMRLSEEIGVSGMDLVDAVAYAFDIELDEHYFRLYGSC